MTYRPLRWRPAATALILLALVPAAEQQQQQQQPDEAQLRAQLKKSLRKGSDTVTMSLVSLLHGQQRLAEAEAVLEQAVGRLPKSASVRTGLGYMYMQESARLTTALEHLRKAAEISPGDRFATNNLCDATLRSGLDGLIECERAVKVGPEMGHNHFLHGRALGKNYRFDEAAEAFEKAIKIDDTGSNPNAAEVYREKASLLETRGRFLEAEHAALRAVEINPSNVGAVMSLGVQRKKLNKWDEASADFQRASGLGPAVEEHKMIINHWGQTLSWSGNHDEAKRMYKAVVDQNSFWLDPRQRPYPNFERGLPSHPWYTNPVSTMMGGSDVARPEQLASTDPLSTIIALLEHPPTSEAVAAEFHGWEYANPESWLPQPEALHNDKVCLNDRAGCYWKVWHVAGKAPLGPASPCNATNYPSTCGLLDAMGKTGLNVRTAQFSELGPGLHIRPHCGATNDRLVLHLGVEIKDSAKKLKMIVGDEVGGWEQGKVTAFDDSFEHEVFHRGEHRRVVLLIHIDHPNLADYRKNGGIINKNGEERVFIPLDRPGGAGGGGAEEIYLDDEDEDDVDAVPMSLAEFLRSVRPPIPDAAVAGYAAALLMSGCCRDVASLRRASRAQLIEAGVKIGHARAILHTSNLAK